MKIGKTKETKLLITLIGITVLLLLVLTSCDKAKETMDNATEKVSDVAGKAGEVTKDAAEKAGDVAKDATKKAGEIAGNAVEKVGDAAKDVTEKAGNVAGNAVGKITDIFSKNGMVGIWKGKLDSRLTTLTITKQDGNNFEGKIQINYRNTVKQKIKGTFNTETKTIKMEDQLHSRYQGKYNGKLSDDGKSYSGTFTTNVDKKNFNFKLVKK